MATDDEDLEIVLAPSNMLLQAVEVRSRWGEYEEAKTRSDTIHDGYESPHIGICKCDSAPVAENGRRLWKPGRETGRPAVQMQGQTTFEDSMKNFNRKFGDWLGDAVGLGLLRG